MSILHVTSSIVSGTGALPLAMKGGPMPIALSSLLWQDPALPPKRKIFPGLFSNKLYQEPDRGSSERPTIKRKKKKKSIRHAL
ncbi:hypothetical protein BO86DRAFT_389237, partial [Aspergillus japonicus CBS 114.51]